MDMGILLKSASGAILTLSLSFNNDGPIGSFFRYICDNGTYCAYYDDLTDGKSNAIDLSRVDVSIDGVEIEDREFIARPSCRRPRCESFRQLSPSCLLLAASYCRRPFRRVL
jgi:2-hydroxy-4-carboxymuconate semialdehyde hemiacetal dehydrogenase